jgi:iron(III) transport system substrate-binding protein
MAYVFFLLYCGGTRRAIWAARRKRKAACRAFYAAGRKAFSVYKIRFFRYNQTNVFGGRTPAGEKGEHKAMQRRTLLKMAAMLPALMPVLSGCQSSMEGAAESFAPEATQRLTVYTSHPEKIRVPFVREFEDRTGIWVETVYGGTQEILNRIESEAGSGAGDIMFGGGVESLSSYERYFMPYQSSELPAITRKEFVSDSYRWTGFSALPLVFLYNTKLILKENAPQTWADLVKPCWEGKIAFCSPEVSGSCYTAISTAIQLYGEGWLEGFVKNLDGKCLSGSNDIATNVASGNYMIGITLESNAMQAIEDGSDLGYFYPADGTSIVPDGVAILNGARNLENAKKFVDFVLSSEAQTYLMEGPGRRPVRDGLKDLILPALSEIPTMEYDVSLAAESKIELLDLWKTLFDEGAGGSV